MPAKTPGKNTPKAKKPVVQKNKKKRVESFSVYIYRVLKQVHYRPRLKRRWPALALTLVRLNMALC